MKFLKKKLLLSVLEIQNVSVAFHHFSFRNCTYLKQKLKHHSRTVDTGSLMLSKCFFSSFSEQQVCENGYDFSEKLSFVVTAFSKKWELKWWLAMEKRTQCLKTNVLGPAELWNSFEEHQSFAWMHLHQLLKLKNWSGALLTKDKGTFVYWKTFWNDDSKFRMIFFEIHRSSPWLVGIFRLNRTEAIPHFWCVKDANLAVPWKRRERMHRHFKITFPGVI